MEHRSAFPSAQVVLDALSDLEVGEACTHNRLTVFPVYPKPRPDGQTKERLNYLTLAEVLGDGTVQITERPSASVPELILRNRGESMVLILDGEEIIGGKQNRIINASFLVAAKTVITLPVSCVEHGRWHDVSSQFSPGEASYFSLRRQKAEQVHENLRISGRPVANQQAIWEQLDEREVASGTRSATGAMNDLYRSERETIGEYERAVTYPKGAVGLVAALNGHVAGADIFDQPRTAELLWPRLIRSYAIDAVGAATPGKDSRDSAVSLLSKPAKAEFEVFSSLALGEDVRFGGNSISGAALVYRDTAVHVSLFSANDSNRRRTARLASSSVRRNFCRSRTQNQSPEA